MSSDQEWMEWVAIQRDVWRTASKGNLDKAAAAINAYLERDLPSDLRSEATAVRASLHEQRGDLASSKRDLLEAQSIAAGGYTRYSLELALGDVCERLSLPDEAAHWYFRALETANDDMATAAGTALLRLLRIRKEEELTSDERQLAERAVILSWKLLMLEGSPNLANLSNAAECLVEAQGRPLPQS